MIKWTKEMDNLLGTMPDADLGAVFDISTEAIWARRRSLEILPFPQRSTLATIDLRIMSFKARIAALEELRTLVQITSQEESPDTVIMALAKAFYPQAFCYDDAALFLGWGVSLARKWITRCLEAELLLYAKRGNGRGHKSFYILNKEANHALPQV